MIVLLAILCVLGLGVFCLSRLSKNTLYEIPGVLLTLTGAVTFILAVISLPLDRVSGYSKIEEYKAFAQTLERARSKGEATDIERAAMQKSIAEWNQYLAKKKYWNDTIFDIWIVDELVELEPLE